MKRPAALALATAFTAIALAGCGGGDDAGEEDAIQAAQQAAEELEKKSVEAATVDALFGALCGLKGQCAEISQKMRADPAQTVVDARAVCEHIEGKNEDKARAEVRKRFSVGSYKPAPKIADDAVHILTIRICPII